MNENTPPNIPPTTPTHPSIKVKRELPPLPEKLGGKGLLEALLRRPGDLALHGDTEQGAAIGRLGIIAIVAMMIFGFVLGTFAYGTQLWAAPVKLVGGLIFAGIICYPSLYIFSSLSGSDISATRLAVFLGGTVALAGLLLLGFAPAIWIFAQGTSSFGFMGGLGIICWLVALIFAFRFLATALKSHGAEQQGPIVIWCIIFLLVTVQLTTSLRPILGSSDELFTKEKKFFLEHWSETISKTLPASEPTPPAEP